jgi:pimeloyl-ACP methyl ester carboxylesterase
MPIQPINNVARNYEERGDRTKPSIVLAGPLLFGAEGFDHLVPLLENDFHLVLLDVHGHGRSGIRVPLVLEDMAEDFHELLLPAGFIQAGLGWPLNRRDAWNAHRLQISR